MVKKILFIAMALILLILLVNKVETNKSVQENMDRVINSIGCQDYTYKFTVNVPVNAVFYVTKSNGIDEMGMFKKIDAYGNYSTILHCGNNYHVIYSAQGYQDYTEDLIVKGFKPIWEESKIITLQKI